MSIESILTLRPTGMKPLPRLPAPQGSSLSWAGKVLAQVLVALVLAWPGLCSGSCIDYSRSIQWVASEMLSESSNCYGIDLQGDLAYLTGFDAETYEGRLIAVDLTNPTDPAVRGAVPLSGMPLDVKYQDGLAFVASYDTGIQIVNVSNPDQLQVIGWTDTPGVAYEVVCDGSYLFVADGEMGLQVVAVADPLHPSIVASLALPGNATSIAMSGGLAVMSGEGTEIYTIDISLPESPRVLGTCTTPGIVYSVEMTGTEAYCALLFESCPQGGLAIVDLSNPGSPQLRGITHTADYSLRLAVSGGYVYVTSLWSTLNVIRVSDPEWPRLVAAASLPGLWNVAVRYPYAFASGNGVHVVEIANEGIPPDLAHIDAAGTLGDIDQELDIAYLAAGTVGLRIIDVSDPNLPEYRGTLDTPGIAHDVALDGHLACIADDSMGLEVVDASNPDLPTLLGSVMTTGPAYEVAMCEEYAYVGCRAELDNSRINIVSILDPQNPQVVGHCSIGSEIRDIEVDSCFVLITNGDLLVIDASTPHSPHVETVFQARGTAASVEILNDCAYVTDTDYGLQVLDISDPRSPELIAELRTPGREVAVAIGGSVAYVGHEGGNCGGSVSMVDISDPAAPRLMASVPKPAIVSSIVATPGYAIAGAGERLDVIGPPCETASVRDRVDLGKDDRLLWAQPNPLRSSTTIIVNAPGDHWTGVDIFDISGRCVRHLSRESGPIRRSSLSWDGRDNDGAPVRRGYYMARLSGSHSRGGCPVVLLR